MKPHCDLFRASSCNTACPNEAIKRLNEEGHHFALLSCSDCEQNSWECVDCIFEGTEFCAKEIEGRFLL